jgi:hypothetical protein
MPFIPRQVKPPARVAITCRVPEETATTLKHYAEFLESTQEHVIVETLRLAFRRDTEFHAWLAATHPEARLAERPPVARPAHPSRPGPADPRRPTAAVAAARPDPRGERSGS